MEPEYDENPTAESRAISPHILKPSVDKWWTGGPIRNDRSRECADCGMRTCTNFNTFFAIGSSNESGGDIGEEDSQVITLRKIETERHERRQLERELQRQTLALAEKSEDIAEIGRRVQGIVDGFDGLKKPEIYDLLRGVLDLLSKPRVSDPIPPLLLDSVTSDFYRRLRQSHPDLTPGDIKLSGLLRSGMDRQQICHLLHLSPDGLKKRRWRLRRRLGLPRGESLEGYLAEMG